MGYRLDQIDKRIIYRLVEDARRISAPDIADELDVSSGAILSDRVASGFGRNIHPPFSDSPPPDIRSSLSDSITL